MTTPAPKDEPDGDGDVAMTEPSGVSSPTELKMALYARCANLPEDSIFGQDQLLSFNIIPDNNLEQLLTHTKRLAKDGLFKVMQREGKICWRVVKKADAAKYVGWQPLGATAKANGPHFHQVQVTQPR